MSSTIAAARAALYQMMLDEPELSGVQVTFGPPDAIEEDEVVALLRVLDPSEDEAQLGAGCKDETYRIEVKVKVHRQAATADDALEIDARGWYLAGIVRDLVHGRNNNNDHTLGGTVNLGASVESQTSDGVQRFVDLGGKDLGWAIFVSLMVRCKARVE